MKLKETKSVIFGFLFLFSALFPCHFGFSQDLGFDIKVDPRIELLAIIQSFTDWPRVGAFTTLSFGYYEDVKTYFEPYRDHPSVQWFNKNLQGGWSYDAPPTAMLHLSSPPEVKIVLPFTKSLIQRGDGRENLDKMIHLMNQFIKDSNFMEFWERQQPFYEEFVKRVKELLPFDKYANLMMDFYGERKANFVFIPVPLFHGGGYGAQIETEKGKVSYYLGGPQKVENKFPVYDIKRIKALVFHEFGHSFVNPVVYDNAGELNRYKSFFQYMKKEMERQAYGNWITACHEHLVRTGESFLLELAGFPEEAKRNYKNNLERGFSLLPFFREKMEFYLKNRDKYPSFRDFFPEIIKVFEEVMPVCSEKPDQMGFVGSFIDNQYKIGKVKEETPFEKAGIKAEDILLYINNTKITEGNYEKAVSFWKNAKKDEKVKITVLRDKREKEFEIKVPFIECYKFVKKVDISPKESTDGIKPLFTYLPDSWVPPLEQSMDHIWEPLCLRGMNYFTFGRPKSELTGYAERSNPFSKYYQAWFGVYVIKSTAKHFGFESDEVRIEELGKLAEFDQRAWLKAMNDPQPVAKFVDFGEKIKVLIDGKERFLYEMSLISHSDLTESQDSNLAKMLGMPPKSEWGHELSAYHELTLKGIYGAWYEELYDVTIVIYGCGSVFKTSSGQVYDHYQKIKEELLALARGIKLVAVEKSS